MPPPTPLPAGEATAEDGGSAHPLELRHQPGVLSDVRVIWRHSLRLGDTPRYCHMRMRMPAAIVDDVMASRTVRSAIGEVGRATGAVNALPAATVPPV